jgi:hypothetical protein
MGGKAKRKRERTRMENEQEVFERVEAWVNDMDNMPNEFNTCNLQPASPGYPHDESCDGNCVTIKKWALALAHERARWRKAGIDSNNVRGDTFAMERRVQVLSDVIIKAGLITEEELSELFLQMMFTDLVALREQFVPAIAKAQARAKIIKPGPAMGPRRMNGPVSP